MALAEAQNLIATNWEVVSIGGRSKFTTEGANTRTVTHYLFNTWYRRATLMRGNCRDTPSIPPSTG